MLDIKYIRDHKDEIVANNQNRASEVDLDALFEADKEKTNLLKKIEQLRAERNKRSKTKPTEEEIKLMKKLGEEVGALEDLLEEKNEALEKLLYKIPNLTHESVPVGADESENMVLRMWGKLPQFDFPPKDHLELGEALGIIDTKTAATVAGARFTYLKGRLALLEFALIQHAMAIATSEEILSKIITQRKLSIPTTPFIPIIPPIMMRPEIMQKMGRLEPREERYHIPSDDLYLVGSAEHTMGPMFMDQTLRELELPLRYIGFSTAFRREAGSYGKDTKGIFRVHQFDKLEFESFTVPEQSLEEQDLFVSLQEYLMQSLGIPHRIVLKCTGDMGLPDYRELDLEAWIPSQNTYRETHTADLMTDYQARRLNTKVKRADGKTEYVHMNDATVFAIGRTLIAIMENYQTTDGHIQVPKVLQPYLGFDSI